MSDIIWTLSHLWSVLKVVVQVALVIAAWFGTIAFCMAILDGDFDFTELGDWLAAIAVVIIDILTIAILHHWYVIIQP